MSKSFIKFWKLTNDLKSEYAFAFSHDWEEIKDRNFPVKEMRKFDGYKNLRILFVKCMYINESTFAEYIKKIKKECKLKGKIYVIDINGEIDKPKITDDSLLYITSEIHLANDEYKILIEQNFISPYIKEVDIKLQNEKLISQSIDSNQEIEGGADIEELLKLQEMWSNGIPISREQCSKLWV